MNSEIFEILFQYILKVEGGLSNNVNDRGGITKYGLISNDVKKYNLKVKDLTIEQAKMIYYNEYYKKFNIDKIRNLKVKLSIFDFVVNSGYKAVYILQDVINELYYEKLTVDGILGSKTIRAINSIHHYILLNEYHKRQVKWYQNIVKNDNSQLKFIKGWINRVSKKQEFISNIIEK